MQTPSPQHTWHDTHDKKSTHGSSDALVAVVQRNATQRNATTHEKTMCVHPTVTQ